MSRGKAGSASSGPAEVAARAATPAAPEALREDGEGGYYVPTMVRHRPSGVVVLPGHPQLGGQYCLADGGDWPCAAVRAALAPDPATNAMPGRGNATKVGSIYPLTPAAPDLPGDYIETEPGSATPAAPTAAWFDNMEHGPAPVAAEDPVTCTDCLETVTEVDAETGECRACYDRKAAPVAAERLDDVTAEAEAAMPKGWRFSISPYYPSGYEAEAHDITRPYKPGRNKNGTGSGGAFDTPAAALRDLIARLGGKA